MVLEICELAIVHSCLPYQNLKILAKTLLLVAKHTKDCAESWVLYISKIRGGFC